jgi:glyoxylase-like metal-dependent hydrolase (beta-lactamase superfamily II)
MMPPQTITDGVRRVANPLVNWYLVEDTDGVTAIDAGFPPDYERLRAALNGAPLRAVVITHGHADHVGFAERARKELGATVYLPEGDVKIATSPIPLAKSEGNPLKYFLRYADTRRLYLGSLRQIGFSGQRIREYTTYRGGEELPVPGRPRAVFSPGHTFGHCALHVPDRDVLFAGDAIVTRDPYTGRQGPCIVAKAATADSALNLRSLDALEATGARHVLTGHGEPWDRGIEEAVARAREAGAF